MNNYEELPIYDDNGINLADHNDRLGIKTEYISLLQEKALVRYLGVGSGDALDIGCGYGRMAMNLANLGYRVTGVDPSERVLTTAAKLQPQHTWKVGALPSLPLPENSFDVACLFSVARVLHLLGTLNACKDIPKYVKENGKIVIIDNLKEGDANYIPESWFNNVFLEHGMRMILKKPIRASRWPGIYMIRYGLVPRTMLDRVASWELDRMSRVKRIPRWSYHNYIFIYEKNK